MTLEERIKQMLEESTKQVEATPEVVAEETKPVVDDKIEEACADSKKDETPAEEKLEAKETKIKAKPVVKESTSGVSDQVSALLEAEGLSEEFKVQAVTIFEAAVTDRVLQIQEELEAKYNEQLDEAKAELEVNIDGFLNETVQQWAKDNEVAIQASFKSRLAESFMDGLQSLLAEHNIDLPAESENALDIALEQVTKLEEEASEVQTTISQLQEQVNELKAEKIMESFKEKMTSTEFDRFAQLTESVKFKDEVQYEKQLNVVLENFGKIKTVVAEKPTEVKQVQEDTLTQAAPIVTESFSSVNRYAQYLQSKAK